MPVSPIGGSYFGATYPGGSGTLSLPYCTLFPVMTGTMTVGNVLSCTTGSWVGPVHYTYQWQRNGSDIPGATISTYTLTTSDAGEIIDCVVTASTVQIDEATRTIDAAAATIDTAVFADVQ